MNEREVKFRKPDVHIWDFLTQLEGGPVLLPDFDPTTNSYRVLMYHRPPTFFIRTKSG